MKLKQLILKNFRNFSDIDVAFSSSSNLLIGENGQGKTNILEAIYLLGMVKSFRSVSDKDLVQYGQESYFVKGLFDENDIESEVTIGYHRNKKQLNFNHNQVKKLSSHIGTIKLATFLQSDIQLIIGAPALRRRYLDMTFSMSFKSYLESLQNYQRIVKNRNLALKQYAEGNRDLDLISVWTEQLIEMGTKILSMRKDNFDLISEIARTMYNSLSFDIGDFHLMYRSSIGDLNQAIPIQDLFRKKLSENLDKEMNYKQSLYGPHKDDFLIRNGTHDFRQFASQGQSRAGALTLKLAMTKYIESISEGKMILLMDDILLDLDNRKKTQFLELIDGRQNFFTSTSLHGFEDIKESSAIYYLSDNKLS